MDYIITTDSNSDVPSEVLNQYGIPVIPQYYAFGDVVYGDEKNMTPKEFYETMRKGDLPKSMANNPAVIREKFETILKKGKDILHIAFSSALSGSCNNVRMTAKELLEEYPERKITIFDSLNASLGEGVSVYRAAELREAGKCMDEVCEGAQDVGDKYGKESGTWRIWKGSPCLYPAWRLYGRCTGSQTYGKRSWV